MHLKLYLEILIGTEYLLQALTMARDEKKYQGILHSTNGIMFMGTPHDGADAAKLASTLAHIAESVKTINREQLDMLKRDSESLQEISRNFGFLDNLKIVTVIESNKTRIPYTGKYILVSKYQTLYSEFAINQLRLCLKLLHYSILVIVKLCLALSTLITTWSANFLVKMIGNTSK